MSLNFYSGMFAVTDSIVKSIGSSRSLLPTIQRACTQMLRLPLLMIAALLSILPFAAIETKTAGAQATIELVEVDAKVVAKGYRASKIIGTNIYNAKGEKIGTLDELVVNGDNVQFAVTQVGGFLGIGGKLVVVPYRDLTIDPEADKIVLGGGDKEQLKKLAGYEYKALGTAPTGLLSRAVPTMSSPSGSPAPGPTGAIDKVVPPMKP